jgi:hypothetical protein
MIALRIQSGRTLLNFITACPNFGNFHLVLKLKEAFKLDDEDCWPELTLTSMSGLIDPIPFELLLQASSIYSKINFIGIETLRILQACIFSKRSNVSFKLVNTNLEGRIATALYSGRAVQVLASILPKLNKLVLWYNEFTADGIDLLSAALHSSNLKELDIGAATAQDLYLLNKLPLHLETLDVAMMGEVIPFNACRLISETITMSSLRRLAIDGASVKGVEVIAQSLPRSKLRTLEITHTQLGVSEIATLTHSLATSHIQRLSLASTSLTDTSAFALAQSLHSLPLHELDISENGISLGAAVVFVNMAARSSRLCALKMGRVWREVQESADWAVVEKTVPSGIRV